MSKNTAAASSPLLVSFLVTSYNKAEYLPAVLSSIWQEALALKAEIILVDDGSSDGSARICERFAYDHPEISFWQQENRGIFPTVNLIAARARGRWVRFCDSDDPLILGSTRRLIDAAEQTNAGVVHGRGIPYGPAPLWENHRPFHPSSPSKVEVHADGLMHLIREMNFTPSMALCRRDALMQSLPLPEDLISCQDLALWFPIVSRLPLCCIEDPVCYNLQNVPNQLSANYALTIHQTIRITQRNADLLSPEHRRAALSKAANRTRRWLRRSAPSRNTARAQIWLAAVNARAKLGLADFKSTLDKIARYYEYDSSRSSDGG